MEPVTIQDSFVHREVKKYKTKGKTEPILNIFDDETNEQLDIKQSINERMAALKKNEEDWKKRNMIVEGENNENVNISEVRPKSIISKINELQLDSENWRKRVPENDAKKFTVASKLDLKLKTNLTENIQAYLSPSTPKQQTNRLKKLGSLNNEQLEESIEEFETNSKRERMLPDFKRVILNKESEIINNAGKILLKFF
jgi:hypothetical protein